MTQNQKTPNSKIEIWVYIAIIVLLTIYGVFGDTETAQALISSVKDAFSIIITSVE